MLMLAAEQEALGRASDLRGAEDLEGAARYQAPSMTLLGTR